jgi:hypothetical protein
MLTLVSYLSLIRFYSEYMVHLRESLVAIIGPDVEDRVEIKVMSDGTAVGGMLCLYFALFIAEWY